MVIGDRGKLEGGKEGGRKQGGGNGDRETGES